MTDHLRNQTRTFPEYVVIIENTHQPRTTSIREAVWTVVTAHSQGRNVQCQIVVEVTSHNLKGDDFVVMVNHKLNKSHWRGPAWNGPCSVTPYSRFRFQI
jgi:hypothetical protein